LQKDDFDMDAIYMFYLDINISLSKLWDHLEGVTHELCMAL